MMEYHPVGWVEPAIPIDVQVCQLLGIAALNPTYEQPSSVVGWITRHWPGLFCSLGAIRTTGSLFVGCAVRTTPSVDGAHGLGGPATPYGGIA
jgi:hypothetical protein